MVVEALAGKIERVRRRRRGCADAQDNGSSDLFLFFILSLIVGACIVIAASAPNANYLIVFQLSIHRSHLVTGWLTIYDHAQWGGGGGVPGTTRGSLNGSCDLPNGDAFPV